MQILARLDADVVALQEVEWSTDEHSLQPFAADAGYEHVVSGWPVAFGEDTQVILSRYPVVQSALLDGDDLSGDPLALDLTRAIPVATIDVDGVHLVIGTAHFKASDDTPSEFRRSVDAHRAVQALGSFDPATDRVLFCGDLNDDIEDAPDSPAMWTYAPGNLPDTYHLGADLTAQMTSVGLPNSAFEPLLEVGLTVLDPVQRSGESLTRPVSGRRLDYVVVSAPLSGASSEVYDTADEQLPGLPMGGVVPTVDTLDAADHLPVVVDLPWSTTPVAPRVVDELVPGDLRITEVLADPSCPDNQGEWVEVLNVLEEAVDLDGLALCDAVACVTVAGLGVVQPGGVVLLGRSEDACGLGADGSTQVDRSWTFDDDGSCQGEPTPGEALDCHGAPFGTPSAYTAWDVPEGDLVLSEVHANPAGCPDEESEWIEVLNQGDRAVDLSELHLADGHLTPERIDTAYLLAPGGRAVFARTVGACGVPEVHGTFTAALTNGGDQVTLHRPDGAALDTMTYEYTWAGKSWQPEDGGWCQAEPTPGAPNTRCP